MVARTSSMPVVWDLQSLVDVAVINPTETLKKGSESPYVAMERLNPFQRKISGFEIRAYRGGMKFRNNDTLVARITPCLENGKTAFVNILSDGQVGFGSTEFIVLRAKPGKSDSRFLYYFATSPDFRASAIKSMTGTSGRQRVQTDLVTEKPFTLPPLPEQKAIAAVLSSLDDKIELLRKQNETLEKIAQTLFKEWFVEFNFPDKNGRPYKSSGGKMMDSELGPIPEGWHVGTIVDVVNIFDSKRVPLSGQERAKRPGTYPYYGATTIMDYVDEYLFDGVHLLLAEDGSVITDDGYPVLQYVWGKFWVNNHAHILQGRQEFSTELLYLFFKQKPVAEIITGAVQLKINQGNLLGVDICVPENEVLSRFNQLIAPMFTKLRANADQGANLSGIRDLLLPKLMSGEIRVDAKAGAGL